MVKIINFLFFAQKVSLGMGSLRPKCFEGYRHYNPSPPKKKKKKKMGAKGVQRGPNLVFFNVYFHYLFIYLFNT